MPDDDEGRIRALLERWAAAVHAGDLAGVLADHAGDVVMFDVPPPHQGVRGLDAYRETWPPFFAWQASGAVFELEAVEVVTGDDAGAVEPERPALREPRQAPMRSGSASSRSASRSSSRTKPAAMASSAACS